MKEICKNCRNKKYTFCTLDLHCVNDNTGCDIFVAPSVNSSGTAFKLKINLLYETFLKEIKPKAKKMEIDPFGNYVLITLKNGAEVMLTDSGINLDESNFMKFVK